MDAFPLRMHGTAEAYQRPRAEARRSELTHPQKRKGTKI